MCRRRVRRGCASVLRARIAIQNSSGIQTPISVVAQLSARQLMAPATRTISQGATNAAHAVSTRISAAFARDGDTARSAVGITTYHDQ